MYSVQVAFLLELLVQQAFYVYYVHIYVYMVSFVTWIWYKTLTPFFPILDVFAPLNDVRAYIAWS